MLDHLNEKQKEVVLTDGNISVVSIPGSGKTTLLVSKIAYILSQSPNNSVCAVTFTKKAAEEMRERVRSVLGNGKNFPEKRLLIKTFNALGLWQMRTAGIKLPRLVNDFTARNKIKSFLVEIKGEVQVTDQDINEFQQKISAIKSSREVRENKGDPNCLPWMDDDILYVYNKYQEFLQHGGLMDFTDQVSLTLEGMLKGNVPPLPYTHLLVDEYQDSDEIQVDWTVFHALKGINTTVVGDDDQSIYSFRGGSGYEGFRNFEKNAPDVKRIVLGFNYRSFQEILDSASTVISHNKKRIPKVLKAHKGSGGKVEVLAAREQVDEMVRIAEIIKEHQEMYPDESWALLTRTRLELLKLEQVFADIGVDYVMTTKGGPLKIKLVNIYLNLLTVMAESVDHAVFETLTLFGISHESIEFHKQRLSIKSNKELCKVDIKKFVVSMPESDKEKWEKGLKAISGFLDMEKYIKVSFPVPVLRYVLKNVIEALPEYDDEYHSPILDGVFDKLKKDKKGGSVAQRVFRLKQYYEKKEQEKNEAPDDAKTNAVSMITMHSSKGLEFDNVVIPFCVEGGIPSKKTLSKEAEVERTEAEDLIEEERRLFYVAMTRAKKRLLMSYHLGKINPFIKYSKYKLIADEFYEALKDAAKYGQGVKISVGDDEDDTKKSRATVYTLLPATPSRFLKETGLINNH